jgi:hypothetical protein
MSSMELGLGEEPSVLIATLCENVGRDTNRTNEITKEIVFKVNGSIPVFYRRRNRNYLLVLLIRPTPP